MNRLDCANRFKVDGQIHYKCKVCNIHIGIRSDLGIDTTDACGSQKQIYIRVWENHYIKSHPFELSIMNNRDKHE